MAQREYWNERKCRQRCPAGPYHREWEGGLWVWVGVREKVRVGLGLRVAV